MLMDERIESGTQRDLGSESGPLFFVRGCHGAGDLCTSFLCCKKIKD